MSETPMHRRLRRCECFTPLELDAGSLLHAPAYKRALDAGVGHSQSRVLIATKALPASRAAEISRPPSRSTTQ